MPCISATPWVTSEAEIVWGAWSSCKQGGLRTRTQVCESGIDCPTETESCIFYGNDTYIIQTIIDTYLYNKYLIYVKAKSKLE